jgi:hypothetical protein
MLVLLLALWGAGLIVPLAFLLELPLERGRELDPLGL